MREVGLHPVMNSSFHLNSCSLSINQKGQLPPNLFTIELAENSSSLYPVVKDQDKQIDIKIYIQTFWNIVRVMIIDINY